MGCEDESRPEDNPVPDVPLLHIPDDDEPCPGCGKAHGFPYPQDVYITSEGMTVVFKVGYTRHHNVGIGVTVTPQMVDDEFQDAIMHLLGILKDRGQGTWKPHIMNEAYAFAIREHNKRRKG